MQSVGVAIVHNRAPEVSPERLGYAPGNVHIADGRVPLEYAYHIGKDKVIEVVDEGFIGKANDDLAVVLVGFVGIVDGGDEVGEGNAVRFAELPPFIVGRIGKGRGTK